LPRPTAEQAFATNSQEISFWASFIEDERNGKHQCIQSCPFNNGTNKDNGIQAFYPIDWGIWDRYEVWDLSIYLRAGERWP